MIRFVLAALLLLSVLAGCTRPPAPAAESPRALPEKPPLSVPAGMVRIPAGRFVMGSDDPRFPDARPLHTVAVDAFYMDAHTVTNAEFARFVQATGYVTVAERPPDPKMFPDMPREKRVPGSAVFVPPAHAVPLDDYTRWWKYVPGACWRHPEGAGSSLRGRENHPVVQVCWDDAWAYARWAGKRLPTEAEWEYAARGGLSQQPFTWGCNYTLHGKPPANTFQGNFPYRNTAEDGYAGTSPVGSFPPNGYGLYDMAGNVWQWCADWYRADYYAESPDKNPPGPADSFDPSAPGQPRRVQRGGSFLCCDAYCARYRPGARGSADPQSGASNVGFRCVLSARPGKE